MIIVTGSVVGVESTIIKLKTESAAARARVAKTVERLGFDMQRVVKQLYLSGAALGVRTGNLRRSVNAVLQDDLNTITSSVGTNVEYGRFWELGFSGTEQVKQSIRTSKLGKEFTVKAHERILDVKARPVLQPALDDMKPAIVRDLATAARNL